MRFSITTAVMTSRAFDIRERRGHQPANPGRRTGNAALNCPGCLAETVRDVLNQDTVGSASSRGKTLIGHQGESVIQVAIYASWLSSCGSGLMAGDEVSHHPCHGSGQRSIPVIFAG